MGLRAGVVLVLALGATGCSLLFGLGDFAGEDVVAANDAGADGERDATDATALSDATAIDGGADAAFCAANAAAFFCEDFESTTNDPLKHFDRVDTAAGTAVVDQKTLLTTSPANDASTSEVTAIVSSHVKGSHARLAFSVRAEEVNTTSDVETQIAKIWFFGPVNYEVGIGIRGSSTSRLFVYEYAADVTYEVIADGAPLSSSTYTRFVLDVDISNGAKKMSLDRDGVRVADAVALSAPTNVGEIEAAVGIPYAQPPHGSWKLRYDDVLLELP